MYIHEETEAGETIVVRNHYSARYKKRGIKRSPNKDKTTETQMRANINKDAWELTIRMNENFTPNDYHCVLTYKDQPENMDAAGRERKNFIRRVKRLYKKHGLEPKYIILTGYGKKHRIHHHMVISGEVPILEVLSLWKAGGSTRKRMQSDMEYSKLAYYFALHRKSWKAHGGTGRMFTCSRNLKRPPTKKYIVRRSDRYTQPRPRKGYEVVTDSIREGTTNEGWPYMSYILLKRRETRAP